MGGDVLLTSGGEVISVSTGEIIGRLAFPLKEYAN
jgi:hypothetical protein